MKYLKIFIVLFFVSFIYAEDLLQEVYARFMLLDQQPEKTLIEMKKIVKSLEDDKYSNNKIAIGYYYLASCYAYNNLPAYYLESINKAIELNPEYIQAYIHRGKANISRKKYDEAKADFLKALELDPENKKAKQGLKKIEINS